MIDLHSHTTASDGTLSPGELVELAAQSGLRAIAITDHDTFDGYEEALNWSTGTSVELVRGIELNSRLERPGERMRWAHILAYFPNGIVSDTFQSWLRSQQKERRERNRRLAARLQSVGISVTLEEVEARGRSLAGRPHFARILVEKGIARDNDDAFRRFLGEDAPAFVARESLTTAEVTRIVRSGGGIPVIAHPIRVELPHGSVERAWLESLKDDGLLGLEVYHSEHDPALQAYYLGLARELGLAPTGGSDFHGAVKPDIELGRGRHHNVHVPYEFLTGLQTLAGLP